MSRIRTIKPEFPQSETIGKLSREARLLFIQLWTLCDDSGRARAASRMLASLLYPYDDDVLSLIEGWLVELEDRDCIRRYVVDGDNYLQVCNWLKHQKIDRPSRSKFPGFDEPSRSLASPREDSSRIKDQGPRTIKERKERELRSPKKKPATPFPDNFIPDDASVKATMDAGMSAADVEREILNIRDWAKSKDERKIDWQSAFRLWIRRSAGRKVVPIDFKKKREDDAIAEMLRGAL